MVNIFRNKFKHFWLKSLHLPSSGAFLSPHSLLCQLILSLGSCKATVSFSLYGLLHLDLWHQSRISGPTQDLLSQKTQERGKVFCFNRTTNEALVFKGVHLSHLKCCLIQKFLSSTLRVSDSGGSGRGLRIFMSNKFLGTVNAAGPEIVI